MQPFLLKEAIHELPLRMYHFQAITPKCFYYNDQSEE